MSNRNLVKQAALKNLRIDKQMNDDLDKASEGTGIKKSELVRFLLSKSLNNLKRDAMKAGGYCNLEITIKRANENHDL